MNHWFFQFKKNGPGSERTCSYSSYNHIPTPSPRVTQVTNLFYEKYCSLRTIDLSPFNHLNRKAGSERTFVSAYPYPQVQEWLRLPTFSKKKLLTKGDLLPVKVVTLDLPARNTKFGSQNAYHYPVWCYYFIIVPISIKRKLMLISHAQLWQTAIDTIHPTPPLTHSSTLI